MHFKDLVAWQKSMELCELVYQLTANFPQEEKYGLTSQMRRSALSIASNIAEGQGRGRSADFGRFLRVANGSRQELETQILLAVRLGMLEESTTDPAIGLIGEIGRLIRGLMRTLPSN